MAQIILHLLVLKLNAKELRYVILGAAEGLYPRSPLFLGADVLEGSGIPPSNHCRIHARYARKGMATKLIFPAKVSCSGVTNIHSGAWFYNLQGLLQLTFEYHDSNIQVDVVNKIGELWKRRHTDPLLPENIQVTLEQLISTDETDDVVSHLMNSDSGVGSPSDEAITDDEPGLISSGHSQGSGTFDPLETCFRTAAPLQDSPGKRDASLRSVLLESLSRFHTLNCSPSEAPYANALLSFLQLVACELDGSGTDDWGLTSFADLICELQFTISDEVKLKSFVSPWGLNDKHNALLCLASEWLGKKLFALNEVVAHRVEDFKQRSSGSNRGRTLPAPHILVPEIFPQCMQLLVGYWSGLYQTSFVPDRKSKPSPSGLSREDHSYSSSLDSGTTTASKDDALPPTKKSRGSGTGDDHNYSSSCSTGTASQGESNPPREDHTYVVPAEVGEVPQVAPSPTRKDHTYVAKHVRRSRASPNNLVTEGAADDGPARKCRSGSQKLMGGSVCVPDSSKYSIVQLVLEFVNNAFVSGVAQSVHSRISVS